jgi:cytochrome P450
MLNTDAPEHARLRAPAAKVFAARSVERWRADVRALVDRHLDDLAGRAEFDVASEFAHPLTLRILAEMLDVPSEQRERFGRWLDEASINLDPLAEDEALAGAVEAARRLQHAFSEQLGGSNGRSDIGVLALLHGACADAKLSRDEFLSMVNLIVIGGYEPTANLIANAVLALLRHPDQLLRLREDESVLAAAVEELLRYDTPVQVAARVTREDVVIGGTAIQRGQPLVVFLGAANHDPAVFKEPSNLDLERTPNPHLAFGAGDLALLHQDEVLDADAVGAGLVVARLVGQDHAGLKRRAADLGDALRPLVHGQIAADPVPGAVVEVEADGP